MKNILILLIALNFSLYGMILELSGGVVSDNQKMITSRFMGFVKNVSVSEGDRVKKGQLLYEIDSNEIDSAKSQVELIVQQAQLSLQMYQSQLNNIQLNLSRHRRLYKKDVVSKAQLEELELAEKNMKDMVLIAKKQVAQALAKLKEVKNQYKYLKIKAPNDGVIIQKNIRDGEIAIPGMPAFVLTDLKHLKVVAEVSEQNLKYVKIGKKVKIEIPSLSKKINGKVSAIIPSSNPMTHTFKVKFSYDIDKIVLFPGMYAKVIIR
jgi:RND family efflux transporter MFP subunit